MRCILTVMALTAANSLAYADWQYTSWSMNRQQVESALANQGIEKLPPFQPVEQQDPSDPLIAFRAPYEAGDISFNALFVFERMSDKLHSVRLVVREAHKCEALRAGLLQKYGTPEADIDKSLRLVKQRDTTWRDVTAKNYLKLNDYTAMGTRGCSVEYKPLQATSTKGL